MATIDTAKNALNQLNRIEKEVLVGKAYPLGTGGSVFSGMGQSFIAKGVVVGKAIAFKHKGTWRVVQG